MKEKCRKWSIWLKNTVNVYAQVKRLELNHRANYIITVKPILHFSCALQ